ncbi:MAG: sigma 54-dependent Fis family transcriptional regulator [Myxococcales bacterium]|nr:sigma 54-dependent Fis family transcriptional regulator [Myxococcales bacterium]
MQGLVLRLAGWRAGEGPELLVTDGEQLIGRAKECDLVLADRSVSRRHLAVRAETGGVRVRTCEAAAPFTIDGRQRTDALVRIGDELTVGGTALVVRRSSVAVYAGSPSRKLADEVRDLEAVIELSEALEGAGDGASMLAALRSWCEAYAGAVETSVLSQKPPDKLVEEALAEGGVRLIAPVPGEPPVSLVVRSRYEEGQLTDVVRALVLVAGRVVAGAARARRAQRALLDERADLRQLTIGSAREFIGSSREAAAVARSLRKLSTGDRTALFVGEAGSGRRFAARLVHEGGARARHALRTIGCAALPPGLAEAELFGGARRVGALEAAGEGTIILHEIALLPVQAQARLARVLETGVLDRPGARPLPIRARIHATTSADLDKLCDDGAFRRDLFTLLAEETVRLPPLRDREGDVELIAEHALADYAPLAARRVIGFTAEAHAVMRKHTWPGNVSELRAAVEHAVLLGESEVVDGPDLPEDVRRGAGALFPSEDDTLELPARLDDVERRAIEAALRASGGNRTRAAALLGVARTALGKKMSARKIE